MTLRPSLCPCFGHVRSLLSECVAHVPVSVSRSAWLSESLNFLNPSGVSQAFAFQTWPLPPPTSRSSPCPAARPGAQRSARRPAGSAPSCRPLRAWPERPRTHQAGDGGGSSLRSFSGPTLGPGASIRSRVRRGAHLDAGGGSGRGPRAGGAGTPERFPRRLLPAGRAQPGGASCRRGCRPRADCVGEGERGPNPSRRK